MSSSHISNQSLQWTRPLLDELFEDVRQAVEQFGDDERERQDGDLDQALEACEKVAGSLAVMEFNSGQLIAEAMGMALEALKSGEVRDEDETIARVLEASAILPDYLDYLESAQTDSPVVVLPTINELRASAGQPALDEAVFFRPAVSEAALPEAENEADLGELRRDYQHALRGFLVNNQDSEALAALSTSALKIRDSQSAPASIRRVGWAAAAVCEALDAQHIASGPNITRLFARLDVTLKQFSEHPDDDAVVAKADDLCRSLLFQVALSQAETPRGKAVFDAFNLAEHTPDHLAQAKIFLAGRNRSLFAAVTKAAREDLAKIKEALGAQLEGDSDPEILNQQTALLESVSESLAMLGLDHIAARVKGQASTLSDLGNNPEDPALLMVARELLVVESQLEESFGLAIDVSDDDTDSTLMPASEQRRVVKQLVKEALEDLAHAKHLLDAINRNKADENALEEAVTILERIGGALRIANLDVVAQMLDAASELSIDQLDATGDESNGGNPEALDVLAETLTVSEFYLETLTSRDRLGKNRNERSRENDEDRPAERQLNATRQRLQNLGYLDTEPASDNNQLSDEQPDGFDTPELSDEASHETSEELAEESLDESSEIMEDELPTAPDLELDSSKPAQQDDAEDSQSIPAASESAEFDLADLDFEDDDLGGEILEDQELEDQELEDKKPGDSDLEDQDLIDRASGDRELDEPDSDEPGSKDSESDAITSLENDQDVADLDELEPLDLEDDETAENIDSTLERKTDSTIDEPSSETVDSDSSSADEIPTDFDETNATAGSDDEAEDDSDSAFDDFDIVEIFVEEFDHELESLKEIVPEWQDNPSDEEHTITIRRAFHSLKGSGRMAGATEIGEFAWHIETMLNRVLDGQLQPDPSITLIVADAINALPSMRARLTGNGEEEHDPAACEAIARRAERAAEGGKDDEAESTDAADSQFSTDEELPPELEGLDATLVELMVKELSENLEVMEHWLHDSEESGHTPEINESMVRVVHTMKGTMRLAPIGDETETAQILEAYLEELSLTHSAPSSAGMEAMNHCAELFRHRLERLRGDDVESSVFDTSALAAELRDLHSQAHRDRTGEHAPYSSVLPLVDAELEEEEAFSSEIEVADEDFDFRDADELSASELDEQSDDSDKSRLESHGDIEADSDEDGEQEDREEGDIEEGLTEEELAEDDETSEAAALEDETLEDETPADEALEDQAQEDEILEVESLENEALEHDEDGHDDKDDEIEDEAVAGLYDASDLDDVEEEDQEAHDGDLKDSDLDTVEAETDPEVTDETSEGVEDSDELDQEQTEWELEAIAAQEAAERDAESGENASEDLAPAESPEPTEQIEDEVLVDSASPTESATDRSAQDSVVEDDSESFESESDDSVVNIDYSDVNDDLLEAFLEEAQELLEHSDGVLQQWRETPDDKSLVTALQRDLHTIKGSSRMVGLNPVGQVAHVMEELLEGIAAGLKEATRDRIDALEAGCDHLHLMIDAVEQRQPVPMHPADDLLADQADEFDEAVDLPELGAEASPGAVDESGDAVARSENLRVPSSLVDELVNYAGEISIFRSRLEQQVSVFRNNVGEVDETVIRLRDQLRKLEIETEAQILARFEREHGPADEQFDPLELDRYSTIQQLSRALAESVNDLTSLTGILDDATRQSETLLMQQSRVNTELQEGLMQARMVSFNTLLPRFRRVLRNASREVNKKAQLQVELAGEGELDRNVLERITAPIEHLLRNAISHGIETPAERRSAGKPETGTVSIEVSREATELVLRIADDGAGFDLDAIRQRAIEHDLLEFGDNSDDATLTQMIFRSGFSTAKQVSELAGRGIGMDVVANDVRQIGGSVTAQSHSGEGALFIIRIPLSLTVMQAIMVRASDRQFAIPLQSVRGVTRILADEWTRAVEDAEPVQEYGGQDYPLLELEPQLDFAPEEVSGGTLSLLMVEAGEQRAALRVSDLLGHREIVIKPVGPQISSIPGILGGTITGDGQVIPILDIGPLIRRAFAREILPGRGDILEADQTQDIKRTPLVMVVDDSITMRRVTSRVLEHRGLEVVTARDGLDAVEALFERVPDLMLLDIEMPRMDGYELATHVRNDPRLKHIPMMMITSRSGEKHRQRAQEIGVNDYLAKPYQEADLVQHVFELLNISPDEG